VSSIALRQVRAGGASSGRHLRLDGVLLFSITALLVLGFIMVSSASISIADRQLGQPFYYTIRQGIYLVVSVLAGFMVFRIGMAHWARAGFACLLLALLLLMVVLVPGVGKEVNGSTRWISLGFFNLQVSEPAKLLVLVYLSGYLVRHGEEVRTRLSGFLKPVAVLVVVCLALLLEPDFGAAVVLLTTSLGLMFLAGVRWWQFLGLIGLAGSAFAILAVSSPYRMQRLTAFLNPWADPFNSGFQLTQSLIAIGRGEFLGVGLGASIQKLFYLPEAHTDFVFAVMAEELGLIGVVVVIGLYVAIIWRAFAIGSVAQQINEHFSAYLAYGIGMWVGLQAFINIGVNMGVLPTKGLTLPLFSYGGSSLVVMCAAFAILLRIDYETRGSLHRLPTRGPNPRARGRARS